MTNNVTQELETTATKEVMVAENTPLTQISAQYGLGENVFTIIDSGSSGTVSSSGSKFVCESGTASDGLATILTLRELTFRPGQGLLCRITADFTTGVAASLQAAGLISNENNFTFGYFGADFGIIYGHDGAAEIQELTITTPAGGGENATVTVDGTGYTVALTAGTAQHNAIEISDSLNSQVPNYEFSANDIDVVAVSEVPGPQGSFAFSSSTAVAAWVQLKAGVDVTLDFTAQADWNIDVLSDFTLDPTKLNAYQIKFTYAGALFSVVNGDGQVRDVHYIKGTNIITAPLVTTPSFRAGWIARNLGNTTNITVSGVSAEGFVEGQKRFDSGIRAEDSSALAVGGSNETILVIRNRLAFNNRTNRAEVLPRFITASTQSNKTTFFELLLNPTFSSDLIFDYIDEAGSIVEFSTDTVLVTGGRLIGSSTATIGDSIQRNFNEGENTDTFLAPGDILAIVGRTSSGPASDMDAALSWQEDI